MGSPVTKLPRCGIRAESDPADSMYSGCEDRARVISLQFASVSIVPLGHLSSADTCAIAHHLADTRSSRNTRRPCCHGERNDTAMGRVPRQARIAEAARTRSWRSRGAIGRQSDYVPLRSSQDSSEDLHRDFHFAISTINQASKSPRYSSTS